MLREKKTVREWLLISCVALLVNLTACSDSNTIVGSIYTEHPHLISIEPDSGVFNTRVIITGDYFGGGKSTNTVHFNGHEAQLVSASKERLEVLVPKNAGSGPVSVTVNGKTGEGSQFTYIYTITVETWAGGVMGNRNGDGESARFNRPWGIATDPSGALYIGDSENALIRKIDRDRHVTTWAGRGWGSGYKDGSADEALFSKPMGLALAPSGMLYVADAHNLAIRSVSYDRDVGTYSGIANGISWKAPSDIAIGPDKTMYVTDPYNFQVKKIDRWGNVSILAGSGRPGDNDGPAESATFTAPLSLALHPDGKRLYVADYYSHRIRQIDIETGSVSTLAGNREPGFRDGDLEMARLNRPTGIEVDADGTILFSDSGNHAIRMIRDEEVVTLAGNGMPGHADGIGDKARFNKPYHLALSYSETFLYITDWENHLVRRMRIE
ncbi:IPT/TIG domain-containing protein [Aliifodinibius sp. S!AR15-10]|uniref:IPT/TIG domain-containing protein n=1 Tax=Aliifodinibius sp. S!AR15-10 TaxID=2950437 RepID=UPI002854696E|nr:IPT/TIG domain-containing protein [Aliifodinibius sp. S!AR15-10]MDR8391512.1 IPT/TIG domain-containing protein [Aliifodinibius sp. S!AR15-10]